MKRRHKNLETGYSTVGNRKLNVYLGGKISKNCWRHDLVKGLREHLWEDGPLIQERFSYQGPFFVSCDHGCAHGEGRHGANLDCGSVVSYEKCEIALLCIEGVQRSDLMFCYIESDDCHATWFEVAVAFMSNIPFVLAFAPGVASPRLNPVWFASELSNWVVFDVKRASLPDVFASALGYFR